MKDEIETIEEEYETKDLYVAAFLQVKGMKVTRFEKSGNTTNKYSPVFFIFKDRDECERLQTVFWNGISKEVEGNLKDYYSAVRDLRARAFAITQNVSRVENQL